MNDVTPNLIARLNAGLNGMSASERAIAEEILRAPGEVTSLSSQALAAKCNVSQSSIIKFCQKIGFPGFPALKIALSAEIARSEKARQIHAGIFSDDSLGAVAKKLFDSKVSALSETMKLNPNARLEQAVDLLDKADRLMIMGVGGSGLVAQDLSSKLTKFGKSVIASGDTHTQLANLASFGTGDLLVAISYSGKTPEVRVAVDHALAHGIPVVFLGVWTRSPAPDVVLQCAADENIVRSASIATRTAQLAVTDLIFVLLAQRQGDVADRISASQDLVQRLSPGKM
ncbi:MAG TPA: SIS domain-containing protein [Aliiroseovarius sp.]|nr:SIS domain-containing protein [Aliiroseovarius sp.]